MVIFRYNLYIFVSIKHGCLTNTVFGVDPNNSVIKRLWCSIHVLPYMAKVSFIYLND